jgi:hypothetical protein
LRTWPPGLAELVEAYARPLGAADAVLVFDAAAGRIRRVELGRPQIHEGRSPKNCSLNENAQRRFGPAA